MVSERLTAFRHRLSIRLGVPATIQPNYSILAAIADDGSQGSTPQTLRDYLKIMRQSHKINALLGNNTNSSDGLHPDPVPIITALDGDLTELRLLSQDTWPPGLRATLLETRLRALLYSVAPTRSVSTVDGATAASFMREARSVAMEMLDILTTSSGQAEPMHHCGLRWLDFTFGSLVLACCSLIYMAQLDQRQGRGRRSVAAPQQPSDQSATAAILKAGKLLRSLSITDYDFFHRMSDVLTYMAKVQGRRKESSARPLVTLPPVRSRMGANLVTEVAKQAQKRWRSDGWNRGALQLPETSPNSERLARNSSRPARGQERPDTSLSQGSTLGSAPDDLDTGQPDGLGDDYMADFGINFDFSCLLDNVFSWNDSDAVGELVATSH